MTTPVIVLIQYSFYNQQFSYRILLSLVTSHHRCPQPRTCLSSSGWASGLRRITSASLPQFVVSIGVGLVTHADVTVNSVGLFFAALGVLVTSLYQIVGTGIRLRRSLARPGAGRSRLTSPFYAQWVKTKQSELELSAFQLLYYQVSQSNGRQVGYRKAANRGGVAPLPLGALVSLYIAGRYPLF